MVWNDPAYKSVSGIFDSARKIEDLLIELDAKRINSDLVNVLMSDKTRAQYTGGGAGSSALEHETKLPEGLSTGAISGGILGGILGALTMAGSILIPGMSLLVAGPIVGAITGTALGSATGGLVGALVGFGIPEYEVKTYEKDLNKTGHVLVIVHAPVSRVDEIKELFKHYGATGIAVQHESSHATVGQSKGTY